MKKLLTWGAVGLLTSALLDPIIYSMLDLPVPWFRDLLMGAGGVGGFYLLIKYRNDL
ncbi:MAG TPA: hypothetical protein HPP94_15545 [Desulfuromonadales bacterium]|nr:hypothetical protein [Desulfuromonadales bacterium]